MKEYYTYIVASKKNGTLYTGVSSDLIKRAYEHKNHLVPGFTQKYNVYMLVYYEEYSDIRDAITREKRIKKWKRQWKIELIEKTNPGWKDLYYDIVGDVDSCFRRNDSDGNRNDNAPRVIPAEAGIQGNEHMDSCFRRNDNKRVDNTDRKLLLALQEGLPIAARPYEELACKVGISERDVISRLSAHKKAGLLKRIDFRLDLKKIGLVRTLIACRIPGTDIPRAKEIILKCKNVTHNYLRRDGLNMWFTLNAPSAQRLHDIMTDLKERLGVKEMLSFKTRKTFKLRFRLDVK